MLYRGLDAINGSRFDYIEPDSDNDEAIHIVWYGWLVAIHTKRSEV